MAKHINNKITDICITTISETMNSQNIITNSNIFLNFKSKNNVLISDNLFENNISINADAFLDALKKSDVDQTILNNIKNNTDLIDEGLVSFFSKNESETITDFTESIKNRIKTITKNEFIQQLSNNIVLNIESNDAITFAGNKLSNTLGIISKVIIQTDEITKTSMELSTKMANSSSITVKNAISILLDSLSKLVSTPLFIILVIVISGGILLITFNKSISNLLFGWMSKKKK